MAYHPQYRSYARADAQGIISIRSIPDDQEIQRLFSGTVLEKYLFFSPDDPLHPDSDDDDEFDDEDED